MKQFLKCKQINSTVTTDNKENKNLILESAESLVLNGILCEKKKDDTGVVD